MKQQNQENSKDEGNKQENQESKTKQKILQKYLEFEKNGRFKNAPQVKAYLETPMEIDEETGEEIINLPFPGNAPKSFETKLKDEDMSPLSVPFMHFASIIRSVDLSYNRLTDGGAKILSILLGSSENIRSLNLKGNQIGDNGCTLIAEKLKDKKHLEYLNLNSNTFGNLGLMAVNDLLFNNLSLHHLDVGCNRYDWDGIISITSAIKTSNESLKVLIMDDPAYKVPNQDFFAHYAEMLADNEQKKGGIEKLSLRLNQIRCEAIRILFYRLTTNRFLTVLDLSGNQVDFQGAIYLRDYLNSEEYSLCLKSLNLSHNKLYDSGAKILADGLAKNNSLVHLDITCNDIHDEGFAYFGEKIIANKSITSIKLFLDNRFGDKSIEVLDKYLESKKGTEFYPDFVIEQDYDPDPTKIKKQIAYLESHHPDENNLLIPK